MRQSLLRSPGRVTLLALFPLSARRPHLVVRHLTCSPWGRLRQQVGSNSDKAAYGCVKSRSVGLYHLPTRAKWVPATSAAAPHQSTTQRSEGLPAARRARQRKGSRTHRWGRGFSTGVSTAASARARPVTPRTASAVPRAHARVTWARARRRSSAALSSRRGPEISARAKRLASRAQPQRAQRAKAAEICVSQAATLPAPQAPASVDRPQAQSESAA